MTSRDLREAHATADGGAEIVVGKIHCHLTHDECERLAAFLKARRSQLSMCPTLEESHYSLRGNHQCQ